MTVDAIIDGVLEREAWPEVSDRAADRGGLTKGGITLRTLAAFKGRPVTRRELVTLDETTARQIYRRLYVDEPGFDALGPELVRSLVVDAGVLMGPASAARLLQRALGVTQDGIVGPRTLAAFAGADVALVYRTVLNYYQDRLIQIALGDPAVVAFRRLNRTTQLENLAGWINRSQAFL